MKKITSILFTSVLSFASLPASAEANDQQFLYRAETSFRYSDKLINPTSQINGPVHDLSLKQQSRRALGLTKAKLFLNWINNDKTSLNLALRPDYNLYQDALGVDREFDSRSGNVFRESSTLKLLDSYSVLVKAGDSFLFELGVFDSMSPTLMAYESILEFGLNVRFVRKFSGMKVIWKIDNEGFAHSQPTTVLGKRFTLMVFQADNDRNEKMEGNNSTFDVSPTSQDPHKGVGLGYNWRPSSEMQVDFLLAFRNNTDPAGVKSNDLMGHISWAYQMSELNWPLHIAQDIRYNRLRFDIAGINAKTLNHFSTSLTAASWIKPTVALYSGIHFGQSEHHLAISPAQAETYEGWQFDAGVKRVANEVLVGHFLFSYENRSLTTLGTTVGGFPSTPNDKKNIARFALQIDYKLGGP